MILELFREIVCILSKRIRSDPVFLYTLLPRALSFPNARCSLHYSPSDCLHRRRCLVPLTLFLSWQSLPLSPSPETSLNPIRISKTFRISQFEPTPAATDWENQHFFELSKYRSHDLIPQGSANARNLRSSCSSSYLLPVLCVLVCTLRSDGAIHPVN
ncbi:hypothetical protein H4582DRAFT_1248136 [Lactarius indigo]|nr:hypothetical protein H4582DRAFT_1248136 [Lactarius indigo]